VSGRLAGALQAWLCALQRPVHGGVLLPPLDRQPPGTAAGEVDSRDLAHIAGEHCGRAGDAGLRSNLRGLRLWHVPETTENCRAVDEGSRASQ